MIKHNHIIAQKASRRPKLSELISQNKIVKEENLFPQNYFA